MSEPIKAGDLVQVVRPQPCCGDISEIGKIFKVGKPSSAYGLCEFCKRVSFTDDFPDTGAKDDWFPRERLKRIPPLEELEGAKSEEKLREPA